MAVLGKIGLTEGQHRLWSAAGQLCWCNAQPSPDAEDWVPPHSPWDGRSPHGLGQNICTNLQKEYCKHLSIPWKLKDPEKLVGLQKTNKIATIPKNATEMLEYSQVFLSVGPPNLAILTNSLRMPRSLITFWNNGWYSMVLVMGCSRTHHTPLQAHSTNSTKALAQRRFPNRTAAESLRPNGLSRDRNVDPLDLIPAVMFNTPYPLMGMINLVPRWNGLMTMFLVPPTIWQQKTKSKSRSLLLVRWYYGLPNQLILLS